MSELYYDLSWTTVNFDDSSWPAASILNAGNCPCNQVGGYCIWGDSSFNTAFSYCRRCKFCCFAGVLFITVKVVTKYINSSGALYLSTVAYC
jgi:hypothetical protein